MPIVETSLQAREDASNPIRVGIIGAGFMGRALAHQIARSQLGMRLVAIGNRTLERARQSFQEAGIEDVVVATSVQDVENAVHQERPVITDDYSLLTDAGNIDCLIEITGSFEYAAQVVVRALENHKHVVLANAELDGTLGPILKSYADRSGVIITGVDGDQPGVELNLYRRVKGMGLIPLICGNIKGLQDHYRTPTTQQGFATKWGQNPFMVTSFADGTKISFEQALVANATGMKVAQRGMIGYTHEGHVDELLPHYDVDMLRELGGIVDYVVGTKPSPGVFVFAAEDDTYQQRFLDYFKLGAGPLYSFYTPFHCCHFEMPFSVARAALFHNATIAPIGAPVVEVITAAKTDLTAGDTIDSYGGYMTYGMCENADVVARDRLLPIGIAGGCRLKRNVSQDAILTFDDVELPPDRLIDRLYSEQLAMSPNQHDEPAVALT